MAKSDHEKHYERSKELLYTSENATWLPQANNILLEVIAYGVLAIYECLTEGREEHNG